MTMLERLRGSSMLSSFEHPGFGWLWVALTFNGFTNGVASVTFGWLALETMSLAFVGAVTVLTFIPRDLRPTPRDESATTKATRSRGAFATALRGFAVLWRNPAVLLLAAIGAGAEIFAFSSDALLPSFARDILEVGETGLGNLTAARQIGGVAGLLSLAALATRLRPGKLLFWMCGLFGIALIGPLGSLETGAVAGALGAPAAQVINAGVFLVVVVAAALLQRTGRWRISSTPDTPEA